MNDFTVTMTWDGEALVWTATSADVPGLVLEDGSFDALIERVSLAAPELLELNCGYTGAINLAFIASRRESLAKIG
ncbi:MAG: DUF1902 domain-containing protein [Oscillospiraceae bacterium]|jgi:hypothetical protein|nr:DUF1902 domain-containing protein [Oscillospiraceae bacterium]